MRGSVPSTYHRVSPDDRVAGPDGRIVDATTSSLVESTNLHSRTQSLSQSATQPLSLSVDQSMGITQSANQSVHQSVGQSDRQLHPDGK